MQQVIKIYRFKVPGTNSKLENPVTGTTSSLLTSPYNNMLAVESGKSQNNDLLVTMTSKADPYDVFNYDGVVAYRLPFVYYTNSESFNDHLTQEE